MDENFKCVPGQPGYKINPEGVVLSFKGRKPRVLAQTLLNGYPSCHFSQGSERKRVHVHTIVASLFCFKPSQDHWQVNHKDLDKTNKHYSNLEWVTPKQNIRHAMENGAKVGHPKGKKNKKRIGVGT